MRRSQKMQQHVRSLGLLRSPDLQVVSHPTEEFSQAKVGAQKLQAAKIAGIASERGAEASRKT